LDVPETYHGHDLSTLVENGTWDRSEVFGGWDEGEGTTRRHVLCRESEWKLIRRPDSEDELYHLVSDPDEQTNVRTEYPEVSDRLYTKIEDHLATVEETSEEPMDRPDINEEAKERLRRLGYTE
jgi:hypothetical protein